MPWRHGKLENGIGDPVINFTKRQLKPLPKYILAKSAPSAHSHRLGGKHANTTVQEDQVRWSYGAAGHAHRYRIRWHIPECVKRAGWCYQEAPLTALRQLPDDCDKASATITSKKCQEGLSRELQAGRPSFIIAEFTHEVLMKTIAQHLKSKMRTDNIDLFKVKHTWIKLIYLLLFIINIFMYHNFIIYLSISIKCATLTHWEASRLAPKY